jgi:hypothetical protein
MYGKFPFSAGNPSKEDETDDNPQINPKRRIKVKF